MRRIRIPVVSTSLFLSKVREDRPDLKIDPIYLTLVFQGQRQMCPSPRSALVVRLEGVDSSNECDIDGVKNQVDSIAIDLWEDLSSALTASGAGGNASRRGCVVERMSGTTTWAPGCPQCSSSFSKTVGREIERSLRQ